MISSITKELELKETRHELETHRQEHSDQQHVSSIFSTLVIRRTVLHDLSVLAIHGTVQINSRPMEIIICFGRKSGDFRG